MQETHGLELFMKQAHSSYRMQKKWSNKWWMLQWNAHSLVTRLAVPVPFVRSVQDHGTFDGITTLVCSVWLTKSPQCQGPWRWTNFLQNLPVMKIRLRIRFLRLGIYVANILGVTCNALTGKGGRRTRACSKQGGCSRNTMFHIGWSILIRLRGGSLQML